MKGNRGGPTSIFDFVAKHWRGEFSLAESTWGVGFLVSLMVNALTGLRDWASLYLSVQGFVLLFFLNLAISYLLWIWLARGIWFSASRLLQEGKGKFGARLARVSLLLACLGTAGQLGAILTDGPFLWQVALGWQPGPPPVVTVSEDGKTLFFRGGFQDGSTTLVADTLLEHPEVTEVVLDSEGGWVGEALGVGSVIQALWLDTHVEAECSSACIFAYLSGDERTAAPTARLGFNYPRLPSIYDAKAELHDAYIAHGLSPEMAAAVMEVHHTDLWTPPLHELMKAGVITAWKAPAGRPTSRESLSSD